MVHRYRYNIIGISLFMRYLTSLWLLLLLFLLPLNAQNIAVEELPLDTLAADSEGDELEELDDLDARSSQLPGKN